MDIYKATLVDSYLFTNFEIMAINTNIHFFFQCATVPLRERTRLKSFINKLFRKEHQKLKSLNYIFCTDKELLNINRNYLKHDFYTDIISFDLSAVRGEMDAEIYISIDRVRENASAFKTSLKQELLRVIFHGALHLCGYDDKSSIEKDLMRKKEDYYIRTFQK